jgi:hypothetical protein
MGTGASVFVLTVGTVWRVGVADGLVCGCEPLDLALDFAPGFA